MVAHRDAGGLRALAAQRRAHGQVQDGARLRGAARRPRGHPGAPHVAVLGNFQDLLYIVSITKNIHSVTVLSVII